MPKKPTQKRIDEVRDLLTELRVLGGEVGIERGRLVALETVTDQTVFAFRRLCEAQSIAIEILRETRCQHCGQRLDDHEIGHEPICFSCFLSDDHFTESTGRS